MYYQCYDKYGNYLGEANTKIQANKRIMNANIMHMRREGCSEREIEAYRQKIESENEGNLQSQKVGCWIFAILGILGLIGILISQ